MQIELLAPVGSAEGIAAVVRNGCDAVYLGLGAFNARRNAKNLTLEEFAEAARYCHVRGVKVYVTLNTLLSDLELAEAAGFVERIAKLGCDAVIVQDLGVLNLVKQVCPSLPVHASTQMSIHNLEGVKLAAALGVSRVVLARELSAKQLRFICENSPIEVEVFVHGALCMSYSGQCYMSSVLGRRSGNRGLCAQPCRLAYGFGGKDEGSFPLSLRDITLAGHLRELSEMGVTSLKIEGRMKRPEYAAAVTGIFSEALREGREPTPEEVQFLAKVFSRQGFTDGYLTGKTGKSMFGKRDEKPDPTLEKLYAGIRKGYVDRPEKGRVPVCFEAQVSEGRATELTVSDSDGHRVTVYGAVPEEALHRATQNAEISTQLYKTGGTPYRCVSAKAKVEESLTIPLSAVNALRREALERLTDLRGSPPEREYTAFTPVKRVPKSITQPQWILQLAKYDQASEELLSLKPSRIYLPLFDPAQTPEKAALLQKSGVPLAVVLPRVIGDHEAAEISGLLDRALESGIHEAVVGNLGHLQFAKAKGFAVRGDFGLNLFNSTALAEAKQLGLISAALSFELMFAQIADLSSGLDTELIVYGRLPLMVTENCIIKNHYGRCACENSITLVDRKSVIFPVLREFKCRNAILNSQKLFLADRQADWSALGLWGARLSFTTENSRECVQVFERYLGQGEYEPNSYTRGLYYRGVE